jgi:thioredoxin 1
MSVIHVSNSKEADKLIKETQGKVLVIDYWAEWCGPCVGFSATFNKLAEQFTDCVFAKINVDECPEAADSAGIQSIPSFHIYFNGVRKDVVVGASEVKLRDSIKSVQAKH